MLGRLRQISLTYALLGQAVDCIAEPLDHNAEEYHERVKFVFEMPLTFLRA